MKIIKRIILVILILLSFYFTNKTAILVRSKDPIMQGILEYASNNSYPSYDAVIDNNYITPGLIGKRINEVKSLINMKSIGVFNKTFLVYDDVIPNISIDNNKNLIINKGNSKKNSISFIIESIDSNIINYLISNNIDASILIDGESINKYSYFEQINNDFNNYNKVDSLLNKKNINTNICIINRNNRKFCEGKKKYLVEPTYVLNEANIILIKNKITSGDIILVKDNVSIDNISLLISYLNSKNINIIKLSSLISEKFDK